MKVKKNGDISTLRILTFAQAARYIGVSESTLRVWVSDGKLPYEELPNTRGKRPFRRIRRADVDAFLDKHYNLPSPGDELDLDDVA